MNANIIKWTFISLIIIAFCIGIVIILKKSSKTTGINISINVINPFNPNGKQTNFNIDSSKLSSFTVTEFINVVCNSANLLPPNTKITDINWKSITISNKSVQIVNGQISQDMDKQRLFNFLGVASSPSSLTFVISYTIACNKNNYPTNLNPCSGQTGVCTDSGWKIIDGGYCPELKDLQNCCSDPNNPYPTCVKDSNGKYTISCGDCPGTKDCGDPGCSLIGPKCTSQGWVCEPGYACPTGTNLTSCCKTDEHATCTITGKKANLICSGCTGTPPTCTPGCDMCGPVCDPDGKWSCRQGALCPDKDVLAQCCTDSSKPIGSCTTSKTDGPLCTDPKTQEIICTNCDNMPKVGTCDPSCEGHGWVCTDKGWVCKPGVQCPSGDFDLQQCCPGERSIPYCDSKTNSIACNCEQGYTPCDSVNCPTKCCRNDVPCNVGPDGNCICCEKDNICTSNGKVICCPDGQICNNGSCVDICGTKENGQPAYCNQGQICNVIGNLTPDIIGKLKNKYQNVNFDNWTNPTKAFICTDQNSGCYFSPNITTVPATIDNYYPCYNFPVSDSDPDNPGPGYCTDADGSASGKCFDKNPTDCGKTAGCTWRNVLQYMASNPVTSIPATQIQKEMDAMQKNPFGNYCNTQNNTSYQRVVAFNGNNICDWNDCWTQLAQPGITDIEFGAPNNSKVCVGLQSCGNNNGMSNSNPNIIKPNEQNAQFPDCKSSTCPVSSPYFCDDKDGTIRQLAYKCDKHACTLDPFGTYPDLNSCNANCVCQGGGSADPNNPNGPCKCPPGGNVGDLCQTPRGSCQVSCIGGGESKRCTITSESCNGGTSTCVDQDNETCTCNLPSEPCW